MYVYRLAHALGDSGHHVDVVHDLDAYHLLHPGPPELGLPDHPLVRTHALSSRFGPVSPLVTHQTGRPYLNRGRLLELFNARAYDVVHYHNISLLGPQVMMLEPRGRAIKLYTAHEHWLVCPMHVLWKFKTRACDKPECLRCTVLGGRPPQLWRSTGLLERASRHVDRFLSPSRFSVRKHAERGFGPALTHLPYFVDRADQDWQRPGPRPQDQPYVLYVGRLEVLKGLQTVIDAWPTHSEFDLLVVGTGTYERALRRQAATNPHITFLGPLAPDELGRLYVHALACVVPSLTYETFGVVVLEAFARQTPVIVRDLGALPEIIQDSGGGLIYRSNAELLRAIGRLARSAALRRELGSRGYTAFLRWGTREAHMARYFDLLRQTAATKFGHVPWEERAAEPDMAADCDVSGKTGLSAEVPGA
jgi:glycosyltransferase involved in cell wall biosynthesis